MINPILHMRIMIRIVLLLVTEYILMCCYDNGIQAQDPGQKLPFLIHPDLMSEDVYKDVMDEEVGTTGGDALDQGTLPGSLVPTGGISGPTNEAMPCPSGCKCEGTQLSPTVACSALNLTDIPDDMSHLTVYLDLSKNNISRLRDFAFSEYRFLAELNLNQNRLSWLHPDVFTGIIDLRMLYLAENRLTSFPNAISKLQHLIVLYMNHNDLEHIPAQAFDSMSLLDDLWLHNNRLKEIPVEALHSTPVLSRLTLAENLIEEIPEFAFRNLTNMHYLIVFNNRIRDIHQHAFDDLSRLIQLELDGNELTLVPNLSSLIDLKELALSHNKIAYLPDDSFKYNKKLTTLRLNSNPIAAYGKNVFKDLPHLPHLMLSEVHNQRDFPDLSGSYGLQTLELDRAQITSIPEDMCIILPRLVKFDIHSNRISRLPNFSACTELLTLNLGNNDLISLEGQLFKYLVNLQDLTLFRNHIEYIPADAFSGLRNLKYLDLQHNDIREIHEDAFLPMTSIEDLNLGENKFSVLPTTGLQNLKNLKTFGNRALKDFPHPDTIPQIHLLTLSYAYHCCEFIRQKNENDEDIMELSEDIIWLPDLSDANYDTSYFTNYTDLYGNYSSEYPEIVNELYANYDFNFSDYYQLPAATNIVNDYKSNYATHDIKIAKPAIVCNPMPGPFMPCDDLMGWWSLRCGVWVVFLLAVLGNGTVLFVSVTSKSKMDVPRFLICNLACADFFMGIYLGFLAIVDASTLGEFKKYAIKWQTSPGCQIAGFLGVLSSELSVFTLTVITLERFYAITHAMHLNKRMSIKKAGYIMACGWLFAILLGMMPQYGISDFRKFAICLPFEIGDSLSLGYVCFIMLMNCIAFLIIVSCYTKMYCSIRGSQAWNSNDTRVAKRMALLVFTDFACWAPITFFSLTAAFGHELISLNDAKVFAIFVLPLNSCANPFLYAIFTKQFKKDCNVLCRRLEESTVNRSLSRASNRNNVSASWGSSRRPSALNSFFNNANDEEKRPRTHTVNRHTGHGTCDIIQEKDTSRPSRISKLFSLRRIKSERVVREPMELSNYESRRKGRIVHFCSTMNESDVMGRSDPSSSAASAPPYTGNRYLIKKSRSHRSLLHFWKRWTGSRESRDHNNLCGPPDVRRKEFNNEPSHSSSSQTQSSNPGLMDTTLLPTARGPRKYKSPYGRKKLRPKRKKAKCCRSSQKSEPCCCANGRTAGQDAASPIDSPLPHPSITDDSSGEIVSSGFSGRSSTSNSDSSDSCPPLRCGIQPIQALASLDAEQGSFDESIQIEGPFVTEAEVCFGDNNNHEYVNVTVDLFTDLREMRANESPCNSDADEPTYDNVASRYNVHCNGYISDMEFGDIQSMNYFNPREPTVCVIAGHSSCLCVDHEIDLTKCKRHTCSFSGDANGTLVNGYDSSARGMSGDLRRCVSEVNRTEDDAAENKPLLLDSHQVSMVNADSRCCSSHLNNIDRKSKSCDMPEFPMEVSTLSTSYKPIYQTSPNLPMLTNL